MGNAGPCQEETVGHKIVISALMGVIFLTASCVFWGAAVPIPPPAITGDNSGGAIVTYAVYETLTEQDYYVQRISPEGDFLWGGRGVLIGSTGNGVPHSEAVSDGSGGAIVKWLECLPEVPGEPPSCRTYAARIDSEGNVLWRREIPGADRVIPDGSGGIIVAFDNLYGNICVLKVDAEGNLPWGEDGVSLSLTYAYPCGIVSDNSGGVIVVDFTFLQGDSYAVYAQKIDSEGTTLWQTGGVQLCACFASGGRAISDGAGGAIVAYERDIPCEDGVGFCDSDICVQRIDAEGNVLCWPDGVPPCAGSSIPLSTEIVADGAGGAIVFFPAEGCEYAQRIDADGHKLWSEDVPVCCDCAYLRIAGDGSGGAFCVSWGGMAQRLDATGTKLWGPDGITFTTRDIEDAGLAIVPDGRGGLLISWSGDIKWTETTWDICNVSYYVQRVDADGNLPWGDEGILLSP
jgi:hypothetical protein